MREAASSINTHVRRRYLQNGPGWLTLLYVLTVIGLLAWWAVATKPWRGRIVAVQEFEVEGTTALKIYWQRGGELVIEYKWRDLDGGFGR